MMPRMPLGKHAKEVLAMAKIFLGLSYRGALNDGQGPSLTISQGGLR
jgi:hypothetical protein